jgi:putative ABC transport system ATP-binding protein
MHGAFAREKRIPVTARAGCVKIPHAKTPFRGVGVQGAMHENERERREPVLEMRDVRFGFEPGRPLFDGAEFRLGAGEFVVLEGPSGAGKSSLLRLLCRFEEPWSGEIRFEGKALAAWPPSRLRRRVQLLRQIPFLFDATLRENLHYPFRLAAAKGQAPPPDRDLEARLETLGLARGLDARAADLSPGEKQRVALVRALLLEPRVLLMDEPTSALDPASAEIVDRLAEAANLERGISILMVSHHGFAPDRVRPRRIRLEKGRLAGPAPPPNREAARESE